MCAVQRAKVLSLVIVSLLIFSQACSPKVVPLEQGTTAPPTNPTEQPSNPTNTPPATNTPAPTATPQLGPPGSSRRNPLPAGSTASIPGWDYQVLEMVRGEQAWAVLQESGYGMNSSASPENEYLLVRIRIKSTHTDGQPHDVTYWDFYVTGELNVAYEQSMFVMGPDPQVEMSIQAGGETEGWLVYEVGKGEGNLILARELYSEEMESTWYYLALDPGASVSTPDELAAMQPEAQGSERSAPAAPLQSVTTADWQATILEVVRGAKAEAMLTAIHENNQPLGGGMEYLALWVRVRYVGAGEAPDWIGMGRFKTVDSAGKEFEKPEGAIPPQPSLDGYLFPGGVMEGWVVSQAPAGDTGVIVRFNPPSEREVVRYLSLDLPQGAATRLRTGHLWIGPAVVEVKQIYEAQDAELQGFKGIHLAVKVLYIDPGVSWSTEKVYLVGPSGEEWVCTKVFGAPLFSIGSENYEMHFQVPVAVEMAVLLINYH